MSESPQLDLHDFEPETEQFLREALRGLRAKPKELPCKYFYDEHGSKLFDRICDLDEYYPTRTELSIMREHVSEMASALGKHVLLVEYGSGSSAKTRSLLAHLVEPAAYVPVDISRNHLLRSAAAIADDYPALEVLPVCADFGEAFPVPAPARPPARTLVYFPGSTIGNFTRERATSLLAGIAALAGPSGGLLIGVDLVKPAAVLEAAYDDAEGVTAAFNLNLLHRMNRELGADFDPELFEHRAVWDEGQGRVEMHLVSREEQSVELGGESIDFAEGESICTEHSHKYTLEGFARMAAEAGLEIEQVWTDPARLFSVQLFRVR